jgi:uncharacterized protein YbjT (DUF2867 family)
MSRYIVAGATGRVGSVAAQELLARGVTPAVIVRTEAARADWVRRGADALVGSLDDVAFLIEALKDASGFFVVLPENVQPDDFHGARRRMANAISAAVVASGVPHVVMQSAIAASITDGNGPAKDLHYLEHLLRATGARLTVLRAAYFQDNVASVLAPATHQGIYPHFLPSDDAAFPMIATKDAGRFAAEALLSPAAKSETVLLLGPAYSPRDIAGKLGAALGKSLHLVAVPPENHVGALMGAGLPQQLAEAVAEMMSAFAKGKIVPSGDRQLVGTTTIDEVIAQVLRPAD